LFNPPFRPHQLIPILSLVFFASLLLYAHKFKPEGRINATWQTAVNETIEEEFCANVKKDLNAWDVSENVVYRKSFETQLKTTISNIKKSLGYFPKLFIVPPEFPIKYYFDESNTLSCDGATAKWLILVPQT
jgi:hypothetical protein